MRRMSLGRWVGGVVLACIGLAAGAVLAPPRAASGEIQPAPVPPAFKAGDQLSLPILQDIANTLHQIDGRLARLEAVFKELSRPRPGAATRN